jgi:hypothetical protein
MPTALGADLIAVLTDPAFQNDGLFTEGSRDGSLEPYRLLQRRLAKVGRVLHTADVFERRNEIPDLVLCMDAPTERLDEILPNAWSSVPKFALLLECEVVNPFNWKPDVQGQFDRLFTWSDTIVDNSRVFRLDLPNFSANAPRDDLEAPDRFCTLVAGNKRSSHPLELYSQRLETIRWFERHHPDQFDLYGIGWDTLVVCGPRPVRALNRLPRRARQALAPRRPSWRGPIQVKHPVLNRYEFTICYENARDIGDYISEKLFDCFLAGSIPVYWGAANIAARVPETCFVDRRRFDSHQELHAHLSTMSMGEKEAMRRTAWEFLRSNIGSLFSMESWVDVLMAHL